MRLPFQKKARQRWVDSPGLTWTPEQPLQAEPAASFTRPKKTPQRKTATVRSAPVLAKPSAPPRVSPAIATAPQTSRPDTFAVLPCEPDIAPPEPEPITAVFPVAAIPDGILSTEPPPFVSPPPPPRYSTRALVMLQSEIPPPPMAANTNVRIRRPLSRLEIRLLIGLAQGLVLYLLFQTRALGFPPGNNPYVVGALSLAGLFAPLLLLEGLGDIALTVLLPWTALIAAGLAALGFYHQWRIVPPGPAHAGFALMGLAALALFVTQALLRGWMAAERPRSYRAAFAVAWTLAARLLIWAVMTGSAWAMLGAGNSLINWLRPHFPGLLRPGIDLSLVILPLVGMASAFAFHLTSRPFLPGMIRNLLLACCTIALAPLVLACGAAVVANFAWTPLPALSCLVAALLLVICLNASYRGEPRRWWRRWSEFAAAFLIITLTALAAVALDARVTAFGWTGPRIYAGAALAILTCYGIAYGGAALISIGGGRWMQRIETANIVLALVVVLTAIALMTPFADPLKLAVQAQAARVERGTVDPDAFDYAWMRGSGLRFGHDALLAMTRGASHEAARNAAIALSVTPGSATPTTPTGIGANITVRTPGARLPGRLLASDWSGQGNTVPPCLTVAALACEAWFMDLDGDGQDEILLVYGNDAHWWASVMKKDPSGAWHPAAGLASPPCRGSLTALRAGDFAPADPLSGWHDLLVAGQRLRLTPLQTPRSHCPA